MDKMETSCFSMIYKIMLKFLNVTLVYIVLFFIFCSCPTRQLQFLRQAVDFMLVLIPPYLWIQVLFLYLLT